MVKTHSRFSPSGSKRWLNCPYSFGMPASPSNPHAIMGTAAHKLGEVCLTHGKNTADYVADRIDIEDDDGNSVLHPVTDDMKNAVQVYLDFARERITPSSVVGIEQEVKLDWILPGKDVHGSVDCYVYTPKGMKLSVIDYKNGVTPVYAQDNTQLRMYALGVLYDLWARQSEEAQQLTDIRGGASVIELCVVQPRAKYADARVTTEEMYIGDLLKWADEVLAPGVEACLAPGERAVCQGGWCRDNYCTLIVDCPAKGSMLKALVEVDKTTNTPSVPTPESLTPEELVYRYKLAKLVAGWEKKAEEHMYKEMEKGVRFPGFKMVEKKANRVLNDDAEIELSKVLGEDLYDKKVKGLGNLEAALKARGFSPAAAKGELDKHCHVPKAGTTIAPESDKRPAVGCNAAMNFALAASFLQ